MTSTQTLIHQTKPRSLFYHGLLLGLICLIAGLLLTWGYLGTRLDIATRAKEDLQASLNQVLPPSLYDNIPANDVITLTSNDHIPVTVYCARLRGQLSAVAFEISRPGYSGIIKLIMGLDRDGNILGVRVLQHRETPGLGDKMELGKSKWILVFNQLSLGNPPSDQWHVKKDNGRFDQFTGATITPRAIVRAIHEGLEFYSAKREQIINDHSEHL